METLTLLGVRLTSQLMYLRAFRNRTDASFLPGITEPDALAWQNLHPALTPTSSLSRVQCKDDQQVTDSVMSVIFASF